MNTNKKNAKLVLSRARELISNGWTRGDYKRIRNGKCYYCAVGAINAACYDLGILRESSSVETVYDLLGFSGATSLIDFNDKLKGRNSVDKKKVIARFDEALAR